MYISEQAQKANIPTRHYKCSAFNLHGVMKGQLCAKEEKSRAIFRVELIASDRGRGSEVTGNSRVPSRCLLKRSILVSIGIKSFLSHQECQNVKRPSALALSYFPFHPSFIRPSNAIDHLGPLKFQLAISSHEVFFSCLHRLQV